ncbi:putative zeta-coat protein [Schistosoma mansoni]|uniref:putative zeta-coat protein n=1 Tax=Schistosoma mansoni TaxID=6183 RepID=UPI0001A63151|nr:putative zeta-coat protein [Schistosoma mansoni]|eukprot:XP_018647956.1 putative zeta-coat protein [Schistosoma mansoni]
MLLEPSLYSINSILILDSEGKRILAKYYDSSFPSVKLQLEFESKLFKKTSKTNGAEITLLDGATCVYRNVGDLYFYVVGDANENELLLVSALQCLYDSVSQALKRSVEKKTLMDNLDLIFLIVDELCHNGILLESDATALMSRVGARTDDIPLGEQTVAQVILALFCQYPRLADQSVYHKFVVDVPLSAISSVTTVA